MKQGIQPLITAIILMGFVFPTCGQSYQYIPHFQYTKNYTTPGPAKPISDHKSEAINTNSETCLSFYAWINENKAPGSSDAIKELTFVNGELNPEHIPCLLKYENLESLSITNNNLNSDILTPIGSLAHLTNLNLCGNCITDLTFLSGVADTLTELALCSNRITTLNTLEQCDKLELLQLSNNSIHHLEKLNTLTALKKLMLSDNAIGPGADNSNTLAGLDFSLFEQLEYVDLSYNNIVDLPNKFSMKQLRELHLNNNNLSQINRLTSICYSLLEDEANPCPLEFLYLQNNHIGTHITFLTAFPNLKKLNISGSNAYLGETNFSSSELAEFDYSDEISSHVLTNFDVFEQLEELDISNRNWNHRDDSFIVPSIPSLKVLNLSNTIINNEPMQSLEGIQNFPALVRLNVSKNGIRDLSPLVSLQHIIELNVSNNSIQSISSFVQGATRPPLKIINLANNEIMGLPSSIHTVWSQLETLDLQNNPLNSIRPIQGLNQIKALNLCCATLNLTDIHSDQSVIDVLGDTLFNLELYTLFISEYLKSAEGFEDLRNHLPYCEFNICSESCEGAN